MLNCFLLLLKAVAIMTKSPTKSQGTMSPIFLALQWKSYIIPTPVSKNRAVVAVTFSTHPGKGEFIQPPIMEGLTITIEESCYLCL